MLSEYSRRELRYSSDALKACLGMLQLLEESDIYSIWGVLRPILPTYHNIPLQIDWYHENPTERRPGFPSWTSIGWAAYIKYAEGHKLWYNKEICEFSVGDCKKPQLALPHRHHMNTREETMKLKGLGEKAPRFLHLKAPVFKVELESIEWTEEQKSHQTVIDWNVDAKYPSRLRATPANGFYASFKVFSGIRMLVRAYLDDPKYRENPGSRHDVTAVLIRLREFAYYRPEGMPMAFFLLLEDRGGHFERVGVLWWDFEDGKQTEVAFATESGELVERVDLSSKEGGNSKLIRYSEDDIKTVVVG